MKAKRKLKFALLMTGAAALFLIGVSYILVVKNDQTYYDELDEALENPDKAEVLVMRNRKMETLPPEIGNLYHLKILNIGNNELKFLPAEIGQLKNLEELSVENNKLTHLPNEILRLTRLRRIHLNQNQLSRFPMLPNTVEEIYLSDNGITEIPSEIRNKVRLKIIDLAENRIDTISVKVNFPDSIRKIDLYHCGLKSVGPSLFLLPALKELILEENPMDDETTDLYGKFKQKQSQ
jgi:Leucine-rich repeat (LRR) protein